MQRNGTHIPTLRHPRHHARDAETESRNRRQSRWEFFRRIVVLGVVAAKAALEEEVVAGGDALVDGEPVADEVHEIVQDLLEVRVSGDGDADVDAGGDEGPDEARDARGFAGEDLRGQADAVDVGDVVGDDGQGEDDHAELAKGSQVDEDGADEAAGAGCVVAGLVAVVAAVDGGRGHDSHGEHLREQERDDQAEPGPEEDFTSRLSSGLVDGIIGSIRGPACSKAVDNRSKGKNRSHLRRSSLPGNVDEISAMRKHAEEDKEDNQRRDPSDEFVVVHDLVAKGAHEESADSDDGDSSATGHAWVDGLDQLGADNRVHGGPANTREHVEAGDCGSYVSFILLAIASSANILSFTP